jgi:hydrogenase nickel incorporation protein HypA/HybF
MHEYSIVSALIDRAEGEARRAGASSIAKLTVRIGELSGVDSRLLATAFDTFKERTLCAAAVMEIEDVPAQWQCPRCGAEPGPGGALRCAACDRPLELRAGDEIVLAHLELEVPDHVY